jgi:hypothetical protein
MVILYGGRMRDEGTCDDLLVSKERTTIETDSLDEETIAAVDRLLRERGGDGILSVSRPRQRLEELFLDIVERAREERLETSGATHGGATAAFLKSDEEAAEEVIERLVAPEAPAEPEEREAPEPAPVEPDDLLIEDLVEEKPEEPEPEREDVKPASEPAEDVDVGMIDALLDEPEKGRGA